MVIYYHQQVPEAQLEIAQQQIPNQPLPVASHPSQPLMPGMQPSQIGQAMSSTQITIPAIPQQSATHAVQMVATKPAQQLTQQVPPVAPSQTVSSLPSVQPVQPVPQQHPPSMPPNVSQGQPVVSTQQLAGATQQGGPHQATVAPVQQPVPAGHDEQQGVAPTRDR